MDFLSRSMAQLRDLFASMTPAARITSVLLLGVIVVSLGYMFQGYSNGSKEYLFNGQLLQPSEAHRIESVIAQKGLTGWERQGDRILVPRGEKAAYLAAVADANALPANFDTLLEESLDLGPFVSEPTRKARMKAVRERQLSMIVRKMDGIEDAQVMYDIREAKGFGKEASSATVSVQPSAGQALTPQRMKMIRAAVAGAVAGMNPKEVMILDLSNSSETASAGGGDVDPAMFDTPYFQERITYEKAMESRISDLLHDIRGVRVKVSAELDPTLSAESRSNKPNGDPAPVRITSGQESTTDTQTDDRGQPGLVAQGPTRTAPEQSVAKNESTHTNDTTDTANFVPTLEEVKQSAGLAPLHVRAAVAIPSEFLTQVWRARNPDKKPEDRPATGDIDQLEKEYSDKVQGVVTPLLPRETGENPYPNVNVTVFQSVPPDKIEPPSVASEGLMWAGQNSGSLIMAGLAVVSLLMLRSLLKSIPPAETNVIFSNPMMAAAHAGGYAGGPAGIYGGGDGGDFDDAGGAAGPDSRRGGAAGGAHGARAPRAGGDKRPRLKLKKGVSMKEDLTDIVREDPDAAAAILRSWIGNAG